MHRFDFLRDGMPSIVERALACRLDGGLRTPVFALATAMLVVTGAALVQTVRLHDARSAEAVQQHHLEETRIALGREKLRSRRVDALLALDRRLRDIRLSGSMVALRLTDFAARVPERAWLTSMQTVSGRTVVEGKTDSLQTLAVTLGALANATRFSDPVLSKADVDRHDPTRPVVAFQLSVADGALK